MKNIFKKMFAKSGDVEKRLSDLEDAVFPQSIFNSMMFYLPSLYTQKEGKKSRLDYQKERIEKLEKMVELLLKRDNLEYVKVTEENGSKRTIETLRKVKKAKKARKDYCDED